jgi:hypothetical protein
LLQTCRQIRSEARQLFYSINTIEISVIYAEGNFPGLLSQKEREAVKTMRLSLWAAQVIADHAHVGHISSELSSFPSLKKIEVYGRIWRQECKAVRRALGLVMGNPRLQVCFVKE